MIPKKPAKAERIRVICSCCEASPTFCNCHACSACGQCVIHKGHNEACPKARKK